MTGIINICNESPTRPGLFQFSADAGMHFVFKRTEIANIRNFQAENS